MSIFSLNAASLTNILSGAGLSSILSTVLRPSYSIRNSDGTTALEVSGVAMLQPSKSATITTSPVEGGKYQAINKVEEPGRIRADVILNGLTGFSGDIPNLFDFTLTSQSEVLEAIKNMVSVAGTYTIDTPKATYESYDLVGYNYAVTSSRGVSMLTVSIEFQEIMQKMSVTLSSPQSKDKPTSNAKANGTTGVASAAAKEAGPVQTSLDNMTKELQNLRSAVGEVTDTITSGISSGLDTIKAGAADVVSSAASKTTAVVKDISGLIK